MITRLKEINQDTIAITDHGNVLSSISFYKKLKENNIRMIYGCEMYICDDLSVKDKDNKYYHLLILCLNEQGRLNLNKLISISELPENTYTKPRIDFNLLSQYNEGLLVTSACIMGEISRFIERGEVEEAKKRALKYKSVFRDNYYLELQSRSDPEQIELNKAIYKLSLELNIPCVVTTDAHYVWEKDRKYQNKYAFNGKYKEDGEGYIDCFIQSEDDVRKRLAYFSDEVVDTLIKNTHVIAEKCYVDMPLSAPIIPHINTPPEFKTNREWLESICEDGFKNKLHIDDLYPEVQEIYRKRYQYELDSLDRMGFIDYILLVYSYANIAKRRGIARGSGGGSLICYLTNITNIDPIEHDLYFERFIDVGALDQLASGEITAKELKIPDIDLDFSSESTETVLKYLYNEYGEENVASIGKFGTNQTKGTIRDMCKVLDIDLKTADAIAKSFENYEIDEIDKLIQSGDKIPIKAQDAVVYVKQYPELFDYVRKLNGLPKSFGLHACGKVISTRPLDEFLPSCYDKNGIRYLQGDMHDIEDVGLVKIDVLALRTIDQEYDTLEMSNEDSEYINPKKQDYSDPKVLDIFRNGDTVGIFQFSSYGMRETLKKMQVSGIYDLAVANALYRPASMAYIDSFCKRKFGKEEVTYIHPDLEPILKSTYGIMVFQEQLIEIGRLAKLRNPDVLRKATGKKNSKLMETVKVELNEKLVQRGWSREQFNRLWADMIEFSKYSFNKSHAVAYSVLAYITAKQKAYYPAEFYAGLCNSYIGHSNYVKDNANEIITDMSMHGIKLAKFDYKNDHRGCSVNNGEILYAIPLIKDCNKIVADALYNLNKNDYKYFWNIVKDLISNGVEKDQLNILIELDFFTSFGNARQLLRIVDMLEFFKYGEAKEVKKDRLNDNEMLYSLISKYGTDIGSTGKELKSFKINDINGLLNACEQYIMSLGIKDLDYKYKIGIQKEYLGFIHLRTNREEDRPKLYIKKIFPLKRKKDGKQFGYNIVTQSIGSGKESMLTVFNRQFSEKQIVEGDIILCKKYTVRGKYFNLDSYDILV